MSPHRTSRRNFLEESFLEGKRRDSNRTQENAGATFRGLLHVLGKFSGVVWAEVWVRPVGGKHRPHLFDHIGVASLGHSNVPFESWTLSGGGEVRGPNKGRREARRSIEDPRFRVKSRRVCRVGDSHFGA